MEIASRGGRRAPFQLAWGGRYGARGTFGFCGLFVPFPPSGVCRDSFLLLEAGGWEKVGEILSPLLPPSLAPSIRLTPLPRLTPLHRRIFPLPAGGRPLTLYMGNI
ncbi:MAG: hypothetical protein D6795_14950 [Deltaproteobacteria bacterium]|nr:MAG: hypothetical protein D6795_14950 [Deltaproteobacteria bacterium]